MYELAGNYYCRCFTYCFIFLTRRNIKDEKQVEQLLKNDFHKSKDEEGDVDSEVGMKQGIAEFNV